MKIRISKIVYIIGTILLFALPVISSAQTVKVSSDNSNYNVGDTFLVQVKLDSGGQPINTISGEVLIPEDIFSISNIETGGSFISLWVEKPNYVMGKISFSGGLPGGYSGSEDTIFSFVLKAKTTGLPIINLQNISAYFNDGRGTAVTSIKLMPLSLQISSNNVSTNKVYSPVTDITKPESLTLAISRDPAIENNKYFVSFFAVDKGSGIARYEVKESPWILSLLGYKKVWTNPANPQILQYQNWISTVTVTAYDTNGNLVRSQVINYFDYMYYYILIIILVVIAILNYKKWYTVISKK